MSLGGGVGSVPHECSVVKPSHSSEQDEEEMAEDDLQIDLDEIPESEGPDA